MLFDRLVTLGLFLQTAEYGQLSLKYCALMQSGLLHLEGEEQRFEDRNYSEFLRIKKR